MNAILGIDIAKAKFDVALLVGDKIKHKVFNNTPCGFTSLTTWLKTRKISHVHACLEATGTYGDDLANFLYNAGHVVSVINPFQIKSYAQSELTRNKTDKADAKIIAKFCKEKNPSAWAPTPEHIEILQALVKRRDDLEAMKQEESNRLDVTQKIVAKHIGEMILGLEKQKKTIEEQIQEHIQAHPDLKSNQDLLLSIPGLGCTTVATILAYLEIEKFDDVRKVVAFFGLNPRKCESGSSVHGKPHISKVGNSKLRSALYFPAIVAMQHNPIIKAFCERLIRRGKCKMIAICAAMRKLLHMIYGILKSNKPFNPEIRIPLTNILAGVNVAKRQRGQQCAPSKKILVTLELTRIPLRSSPSPAVP